MHAAAGDPRFQTRVADCAWWLDCKTYVIPPPHYRVDYRKSGFPAWRSKRFTDDLEIARAEAASLRRRPSLEVRIVRVTEEVVETLEAK